MKLCGFCKDEHLILIDSCKLAACLQGVSNNIEEITNSRTLNVPSLGGIRFNSNLLKIFIRLRVEKIIDRKSVV